jgi:uncharacterized coiled-coil protein SlyX
MTEFMKGPADSLGQTSASPGDEADSTSPTQLRHSALTGDAVVAEAAEGAATDELMEVSAPAASQAAADKPPEDSTKHRQPKSPKPQVETLEQFIAEAYSRKGKPVVFDNKTERKLALGPGLDNDARSRLLELAQKDILLDVSRQLLLVALRAGSAKVRGELREFVGAALRRHKAFGSERLLAALKNLSDSPSLNQALALAASINAPAEEPQQPPLKPGDIARLRSNAAYTLAIWFVVTRDTSLAELSQGLFHALWQPPTGEKESEHARLRALTQISDPAGVGVACQSFKEEADRQTALAQSARQEKEWALERASSLEREVARLKQTLHEKEQAIAELNQDLIEQRTEYENALTFHRDEFQHLRGRLLRRLRSEVGLLDDALHALRKDPPKVDIMDDHAERVVEALRTEIKNLEEAE